MVFLEQPVDRCQAELQHGKPGSGVTKWQMMKISANSLDSFELRKACCWHCLKCLTKAFRINFV
jgi:hypothetical protein